MFLISKILNKMQLNSNNVAWKIRWYIFFAYLTLIYMSTFRLRFWFCCTSSPVLPTLQIISRGSVKNTISDDLIRLTLALIWYNIKTSKIPIKRWRFIILHFIICRSIYGHILSQILQFRLSVSHISTQTLHAYDKDNSMETPLVFSCFVDTTVHL